MTNDTTPRASAKAQFDSVWSVSDGDDPIERLRCFCSKAMNGQDWFDVEPFLDALTSRATCEGARSIPSEADAASFEAWCPYSGNPDPWVVWQAARKSLRAALAVPSEGIASVAASDGSNQLLGLLAIQAEDIRKVLDELAPETVGNLQTRIRAALAVSDESLSRQSSEAAESLRSTRNTASERAAYEAHILSIGVPSMLERGSGIYSYTDRIIEAGWAGWQARAALRATTEPSLHSNRQGILDNSPEPSPETKL